MANTLLDYFFKITAINPTPAASTAFLKQVCLVVAPKDVGVTRGVPVLCTSNAAVALLTNNTEAAQLFNAGMTRVYILPMDDLDLADVMDVYGTDFFTVLISSDFDKDDVEETQAQGVFTVSSYANLVSGTADKLTVAGVEFTFQAGAVTLGQALIQAATSNNATAASIVAQINGHATAGALVVASAVGAVVTVKAKNPGSAGNDIAASYTDNDTNVGGAWTGLSGGKLAGGDGLFLGVFDGVVGISSSDMTFLETQAAIEKRCAFYTSGTNYAKNMCYAFGKMLSNSLDWTNQQYIQMPFADDIDEVGEAENLFDLKISFVLTDSGQYGNRLALFCAGGSAIVAPYILRNLEIDMQSKALQYVSANQPAYTKKHAALIEDELDKVINGSQDARGYVQKGWIEEGSVEVLLEQDDFVASSNIAVKKPRALWRITGEMRQS